MCTSCTLPWRVPHFCHCWTPSPLQAHWGRWRHTHLLWLACLFTVCMKEHLFSPSGGAFHTTATVTSFPHSKVAGWTPPLLPSQACLFIIHVKECPSLSLQSSGHPTLFVACVFFFSCFFIIQFFFLFSLGWGQSVQGAMLICPREYRMPSICSPGGLLSRVGAGVWWHSSWFLCLMWRGDAMHGLGVWRCQSFASSW
jgi:hypothetical protein